VGTAIQALRDHLAPLHDLQAIGLGLHWDQQVMMPPRGAGARAEALASVERLHHEAFTSAETGRLIDDAARETDGLDPDAPEACLVAVTRRDWDKARRVPTDLAAAIARASATGYEAWTRAREASSWGAFAPSFTEMLELKRRYVACFDEFDCAYDALLDDYEHGATTTQVGTVFDRLATELPPLVAAAAEHADRVSDACLHGDFPPADQERLLRRVLPAMGFTEDAWRLDTAIHPFAASYAPDDVRVTTRYDPEFLPEALYSGLHETGHGLYEAGTDPAWTRTPIAGGVSLGLHESQSRLWENMVGRSRSFSRWLLPMLAEAFPAAFGGVDADGYWRAVNRVAPSFIRVEADETTYSLHVILRYELEQDLIEGRLVVADVPDAWNAKMREYLGLEVPDDAAGALQDVHWSAGVLGYFPTYALGNVMAAQIWTAASAALPDLDGQLERGELTPLREWLREHLHRFGRRFTPAETLARVAGGPLDPDPYLAYLRGKVADVYGLA
jgi:carboxypeptidase Taq